MPAVVLIPLEVPWGFPWLRFVIRTDGTHQQAFGFGGKGNFGRPVNPAELAHWRGDFGGMPGLARIGRDFDTLDRLADTTTGEGDPFDRERGPGDCGRG